MDEMKMMRRTKVVERERERERELPLFVVNFDMMRKK
jgi:hypothetical protein